MIKDVLSGIGGVGVYGVISVALFFVVFLGVVVWACLLKRPHLEAMSRLPLQDGSETTPGTPATLKPDQGHE